MKLLIELLSSPETYLLKSHIELLVSVSNVFIMDYVSYSWTSGNFYILQLLKFTNLKTDLITCRAFQLSLCTKVSSDAVVRVPRKVNSKLSSPT